MRLFVAFLLLAAAAALMGVATTGMPASALDRGATHASAGSGAPIRAPPDRNPLPPLGEIVRHVFTVEAKQVPLPAGDWHVVGSAVTAGGSGGRQPTGPVVSKVLLRLRGNVADAAVLIQTNKAEAGAAWGRPTGCERSDFYAARIRYASDHDGACSYVAYVNATPRSSIAVDAAWRDAARQAIAMGVRLPMHWLVAAYRVTDPHDALQVRYFFPPPGSGPADGVPGPDAAPVPRRQAGSFVAWSDSVSPAIGRGFRNRLRLGEGPAIADWPMADAGPAGTPAARAEARTDEAALVSHLGLKTITYRIFGTMTDFGVNYLYLGSAAAAGSLSVVGAVASSALYFVHELAWSYADAPTQEIRDLPGIGLEQAAPRAE